MSKMNGNTSTQNGSKIDAIKELIFGQTMQEYDQRFSTLEALLISNQKQLEKSSQQQISKLQKELESYRAESEQKMKALQSKLEKKMGELDEKKVEIATLKKHLILLVENL